MAANQPHLRSFGSEAGVANSRQTIALIDLAVPNLGPNQENAESSRMEATLRKLDGLTLLEWCVRRISESTLVDTIIVTGPQQCREKISQTGLCSARWIPSAQPTAAKRAYEIAERFNAEWIVFASPLCPFTDPTLLDRLISRGWANPEADFVGFVAPRRPQFSLQSLGLVGEMCSLRALNKLEKENLLGEMKDVPDLIRRYPELFSTKWIPLPDELSREDLCFRLATAADRDRAASYLEAMGDDLCWQRLARVAEQLA